MSNSSEEDVRTVSKRSPENESQKSSVIKGLKKLKIKEVSR
jgi:hypothetical protein